MSVGLERVLRLPDLVILAAKYATVPAVTFLRATSVPRKLNLDRNLAVPLHMAWA
jgi:hypothetical protein